MVGTRRCCGDHFATLASARYDASAHVAAFVRLIVAPTRAPPYSPHMASPAGVLATALASKDADAAAKAYETLSDQKLDARTYAKTSDLMARSRKNQLAWDAFEAGRTHHGVPTLLKSGLNFNALLYACCREKEMLDKAMAVWELMTEHEVKPDAEPAEKLLLANLAKGKYDDAFSTFLGCVDAGIQPAQPACTALVKTSAVVPRLAQMAFAVQLTMKTAGMEMPNDLLISLQKACMSTGTADQCLALQADLDAAGAPLDAARISKLACKCAEAGGPMPSKGAELLTQLRAAGTAAGASASAAATLIGTSTAYEAVLTALVKSAMARTNPSTAQAAHTVLIEMQGVGHTPSATSLTPLLTVCCRTGQRRQALAAFRALTATGTRVEPGLLKSLILTLGKSAGATSWHDVPSEDVQQIVDTMNSLREGFGGGGGGGGGLELDKELAAALVRLTASCGTRPDARARLKAMVEARDPPMPPGSALLAHYIAACGKHAHGPEEGCRAFTELSKGPSRPLKAHGHLDGSSTRVLIPAAPRNRPDLLQASSLARRRS